MFYKYLLPPSLQRPFSQSEHSLDRQKLPAVPRVHLAVKRFSSHAHFTPLVLLQSLPPHPRIMTVSPCVTFPKPFIINIQIYKQPGFTCGWNTCNGGDSLVRVN